jgi:5-methylcytosine-specific restriction endonuclease McrA
MDKWIAIKKDNAHIIREKKKAAQLRKTQWWKNRIARGQCHYCKKYFSAGDLTMDHIVPLARGGKSIKGNVVPCCKSCNNKKKYLTPVELRLNDINKQK